MLALILALWADPAHAGGTISMSTITVNGLEVRDLECTLDKQSGFAMLDLMGALSDAKPKLDTCFPAGAAAKTTWTWGGTAPSATVVSGVTGDAVKCVQDAVTGVQNGPVGTCTGTLLIGDPAAAQKAADAMVKPQEPAPG